MDQVPPIIGSTNLAIRYELTRFDLFVNYPTLSIRNWGLGCFLLFCCAFSTGATVLGDRSTLQDKSLPFVIFYIFFVMGSWLVLLAAFLALSGALIVFTKKDAGIFCQHVLEITDEGLVESTEVNRGLHKWAGFHKIISGRNYLYIYTGPMRHFQVPRRGIPPAELISFEAELKRRVQAAKK